MANASNKPDGEVGYRRPPVSTRFKPGRSGNPSGRPKGAKGTKATAKRVLMEKHRADPEGTGRAREYTALELTILLLKKLAAGGDQRAYRTLMDLSRRFGPAEEESVGFLIVPESCDTIEEWIALHSPKDDPPPVGPTED